MWERFSWTQEDQDRWAEVWPKAKKVLTLSLVPVGGCWDCIIKKGNETLAIVGGVNEEHAKKGAAHYIMDELEF